MNKQKTLVFFGAHPDDETFGPGTTLAQYVLRGVSVYCVCATRGEAGTVDAEFMKGFATISDLRTAELERAVKKLGLTGLIFLNYRDSGMPGSPDNKHSNALAATPVEQVSVKMVKIIRELKPDVVLTHDAGGGYGHPDHIAVHTAAVKAFYAANDPAQYPEAGPVYQPSKLYFSTRPRGLMKLAIRIMPLLGRDPHHFGRNRDIDLTKMLGQEYPVHAVIRLSRKAVKIQREASACHASQGGGQPRRGPFRLFGIMEKLRGPRDYFTRDYPPPTKKREKDLFEGVR
jgi:LmbE family N-acetylglucosaminyl deacetylase